LSFEATLLLAAGCASASTSPPISLANPQPSAAPPQMFGPGTGVLTISLAIPRAATKSKIRRRTPKFISPATSSVTVGVDGGGASPAVATCSSGTCTVTLDLALGTHTLAIRLWDAPNGGGQELASYTAGSCNVVSGNANTCSITMYGFASSLEMTTISPNVSGSQSAGFTFLTASPVPFTIDALDADGYEILGPGAITPSVSTAGSGISIATPAPSASPIYSITDQNPATQTIVLSSTPAPNSDGSPLTTGVSVRGETCAQNAISGQGVPLGSVATFAVLAATTVTNAGPTVVSGNLGVSPGTAITGFGPGIVENGSMYPGGPVAAQAQNDLALAYNNATGRSGAVPVAAELGGLTLTPGVYRAPTSEALTGNVTLDGQNDPNSVFIITIGTSFGVAANSSVTLVNGTDPCNVFWTVGTSATIAANAMMAGTFLVNTTVTLADGVAVHGRVLAETGAVTLTNNAITDTRP
jgi:hypothetical protein